MNVRFRVSAAPLGADPVIVEHFETRADAETYWEGLQAPDGVLSALPVKAAVMSLEEFYEGTWVLLNRLTVVVS